MFAVGIGISALFFVLYLVFYKPVQRKSAPADISIPQNNGSAPQYTPPQYTPPQDVNNIKQPISPDDFFDKPIKKEPPKQEKTPTEVPKEMEGLGEPTAELPYESDVPCNQTDIGAMDGISTDDFSYDDYDELVQSDESATYDDMDGIESVELPDDYSDESF